MAKQQGFQQKVFGQFDKYLKNIDFPINKESLINKLKENNVAQMLMQQFNQLPDQEYKNSDEVIQHLQNKEVSENLPESPEDRQMREDIEHEAGLDKDMQSDQKKGVPRG